MAEKEKLEDEKPKTPRLNEDVLGIILKFVVKKEQRNIIESVFDIECSLMLEHPGLKMEEDIEVRSRSEGVDLDHVIWPDYLHSNSRRLIHHTNVKLFPNRELTIHKALTLRITRKRELDEFWKAAKHFGLVLHMLDDRGNLEELDVAVYFRQLWTMIQSRQAGPK